MLEDFNFKEDKTVVINIPTLEDIVRNVIENNIPTHVFSGVILSPFGDGNSIDVECKISTVRGYTIEFFVYGEYYKTIHSDTVEMLLTNTSETIKVIHAADIW